MSTLTYSRSSHSLRASRGSGIHSRSWRALRISSKKSSIGLRALYTLSNAALIPLISGQLMVISVTDFSVLHTEPMCPNATKKINHQLLQSTLSSTLTVTCTIVIIIYRVQKCCHQTTKEGTNPWQKQRESIKTFHKLCLISMFCSK